MIGQIRQQVSRPTRALSRTALYLTVAMVTVLVFFPVYWMLVISLRPTRETISYPPTLFPHTFQLAAYRELFSSVPIAMWLRNTIVVSTGVTVIVLVLSICGAYALSDFQWRGRAWFGFILLAAQMLPEALLVTPIFVIFRRAGLTNTLHGLILVDAAFIVPLGIWILKGFLDTIPREVREAALVDGCSPLGVLTKVILPLSVPALVAVSVIAFFDGWNEYLFASTFITTAELRPATVGLASFIGELATPVELVFAATAVFTIPPILFYFFMQRFLISGLTGGAVKG
jgi:multiple sugar transport system permease protein